MSSIQERLQLKRVPLDSWNIREQLCLASAVVRSGDQNWMSVSRALKTVGDTNRPPDWYSQKSCAAQYGALLEHVETPKRKKRSSEGAGETPQESIVKRLTQDRIAEIQKAVAELTQQHDTIKNEINEVLNTSTSEDRLREIWSNIEANKRARERESARRAAWLKEREERRARAARNGRGSVSNAPPSPGAATPAPPSSPLLTSLLKSSPVVTTPQHIPHPATVVDTISPSVTAPTLSMLLEKNSPQQDSKRAAIEHIKSQLVQIEQQLKANTTPPPAPIAPAVDIDDIEIKAEDVYVFRDIDLNIPQVNSTEKAAEKPEKKEEDEQVEIEVETVTATEDVETDDKEEEVNIEVTEEIPIEVETEPQQEAEVKTEEEETPEETREDEDIKISFPEVKFPTPEIKVIEPDDQKQIKEEVKDPQPIKEEIQQEVEEEIVVQENESVEEVVEEVSIQEEPPPQLEPPAEPELVAQHEAIETKDIPLPPEPAPEPVVLVTEPPLPPEPEVEVKEEPEPEPEPEIVVETQEVEVEPVTTPSVVEKSEDDLKREEDAEDSIPLKQMLRDETLRTIKEERIIEDAHTETDDDTPMELSREEEKDGKKKRDYSRKKKPDSRTCSGSESAPESPSSSDTDRQHRLWKKSVMLVYSRLCAHKYASLFLRPISDEEAPGYSAVVKRPMDLTTIRKNIENGVIRTTAEFQRDVLLMLSNALFYNSSEHSVYTMAKELHEEAACQLGMLLAAQAHAGLCAPPHARKRRRLHGKRTA